MSDLLLGGLLIQIFAPFLVTCIFTLIGFFVGRAYGRRQGYHVGWKDGYDDAGDFFLDLKAGKGDDSDV